MNSMTKQNITWRNNELYDEPINPMTKQYVFVTKQLKNVAKQCQDNYETTKIRNETILFGDDTINIMTKQ